MKINDLLSVVLLAQLKKCCTSETELNNNNNNMEKCCAGINEAMGSTPIQAWIFKLSFHNCQSCVYNYGDLISFNEVHFIGITTLLVTKKNNCGYKQLLLSNKT